MDRPERDWSERPSALTTPAVTVVWKPYGLPMATAIWPARIACESPSWAGTRFGASMRTTARSVCGSSPTTAAATRRPSASDTSILLAPRMTWLLVNAKPSGVKMKPEPLPPRLGRAPRLGLDGAGNSTSILMTDGATRSTALVTTREYASSASSSSSGPSRGLERTCRATWFDLVLSGKTGRDQCEFLAL